MYTLRRIVLIRDPLTFLGKKRTGKEKDDEKEEKSERSMRESKGKKKVVKKTNETKRFFKGFPFHISYFAKSFIY